MRLAFSLLLMLAASGIVSASETEFRLAGILSLDDGSAVALIESSSGEQRWYREGDEIGLGVIDSVTARSVRIAMSGRNVVLQLAGTDKPSPPPPAAAERPDQSVQATNPVHPRNLLDVKRLAEAADEPRPEELAERTMAFLSLPANTQITAINDEPVDDPADALTKMAKNISAESVANPGLQFIISLSGPAGVSRVYVFADENSRIYIP